jgi:transcription-repair coupling factor (superfamily II helicase)
MASRSSGVRVLPLPPRQAAHERLATIAQHTELGTDMYVAMKDLEIRGAG